MMMKRRRKAEVNVLMILLCIQPTKQNQTAKKSKDKHLKSVISGALLNTTQYMSRSTPRRYRQSPSIKPQYRLQKISGLGVGNCEQIAHSKQHMVRKILTSTAVNTYVNVGYLFKLTRHQQGTTLNKRRLWQWLCFYVDRKHPASINIHCQDSKSQGKNNNNRITVQDNAKITDTQRISEYTKHGQGEYAGTMLTMRDFMGQMVDPLVSARLNGIKI